MRFRFATQSSRSAQRSESDSRSRSTSSQSTSISRNLGTVGVTRARTVEVPPLDFGGRSRGEPSAAWTSPSKGSIPGDRPKRGQRIPPARATGIPAKSAAGRERLEDQRRCPDLQSRRKRAQIRVPKDDVEPAANPGIGVGSSRVLINGRRCMVSHSAVPRKIRALGH